MTRGETWGQAATVPGDALNSLQQGVAMKFECEQCGEILDVEIGEAKELFQIGRYDLDCGGKQCHQSDVQRFTLHLSAAEMAILVPRNNKTVSVG